MKKYIVYLIAVCVVTSFFPFIVFGVEVPKTINVSFSLTCDDDEIKSEFKSYISRELRSLGDVIITSVDKKYELLIDVVVTKSRNISESQVSLAVLTLEKHSTLEEVTLFGTTDFDVYSRPEHYVFVGTLDDIPEISRKIVLKFDVEKIQIRRNIYEQLRMYRETVDKKMPWLK